MMVLKKYTTVFWVCLLVLLPACEEISTSLAPVKTWEKDQKKMVLISAGEFIMGTDKTDPDNTHQRIGAVKPLYLDQHPQRSVVLDAYYIDAYEVTNLEYKRFIDDAQYPELPSHWVEGEIPEGLENHPVTHITWIEAWSYAAWAGKRLPTEAQWEKAARGSDGRLYPWGNEYVKGKANIGIDGDRKIMPVGSYPEDVSAYGVFDLAGNVMEWTRDWYRAYPGNGYSNPRFGENFKVLRGSAFQKAGHYFLEAYRYAFARTEALPADYFENVGFRCVTPFIP